LDNVKRITSSKFEGQSQTYKLHRDKDISLLNIVCAIHLCRYIGMFDDHHEDPLEPTGVENCNVLTYRFRDVIDHVISRAPMRAMKGHLDPFKQK
jgi:hypothetical protein